MNSLLHLVPSDMTAPRMTESFRAAVPRSLIDAFDGERDSAYAVDRDLHLVYVNPAWQRFAQANAASPLADSELLGRSLRAVVADSLWPFYCAAFDSVFSSGAPWAHEYECSSPTQFRRFRMRMMRVGDGRFVLIANDLVDERAMDAPTVQHELERYVCADGLVSQCAHCRRVRQVTTDSWDWVPQLLRDPPARVSHGLCAACLEYHYPGG